MIAPPDNLSPSSPESNVKSILEWLALAHGRTGSDDADQLHRQLMLLREAPIPNAQRLKLLDLLFGQAERVANGELPRLREVSLPISRKRSSKISQSSVPIYASCQKRRSWSKAISPCGNQRTKTKMAVGM